MFIQMITLSNFYGALFSFFIADLLSVFQHLAGYMIYSIINAKKKKIYVHTPENFLGKYSYV